MAESKSNYVHGEMPIDEQTKMYREFISHGAWVGSITAMLLLHLILVFMTPAGPFLALGVTALVGLLAGLFLKFKPGYFGLWFIYVAAGLMVTLSSLLILRLV